MGNLGNIPNFEPAVGLFIDGAYRSKSGLGVGQLVDVDRVEVLRGPQSTLYGRNVTAGIISVFTRRPTDTFEGFLEASAGNYDSAVVKASVSGPLAFQPTDRLSILAIAGFSEKDVDCCNSDVELGFLGTALSGLIMVSEPDTDPTNRVAQFSQTNTYEDEASELTLTIQYDFENAILTSLTSYDEFDIYGVLDAEQSPLDALTFHDRQEGETFSQEFRLTSSGDGDVDWMTGLAYYKNDFTRESLDSNKPMTILGAGIRWFYEEKDMTIDSRADTAVFPSYALITTVPAPVAGDRDTDQVAWNLSASFHTTDDTMVYGSVSRGAKGGA